MQGQAAAVEEITDMVLARCVNRLHGFVDNSTLWMCSKRIVTRRACNYLKSNNTTRKNLQLIHPDGLAALVVGVFDEIHAASQTIHVYNSFG